MRSVFLIFSGVNMNKRRPASEDEVEFYNKMVSEGRSLWWVATELGYCHKVFRNMLSFERRAAEKEERVISYINGPGKGMSAVEIGSAINVSSSYVRDVARRRGILIKSKSVKWTIDESDRLVSMYYSGMSFKEIARSLGSEFNDKQCSSKLYRMLGRM